MTIFTKVTKLNILRYLDYDFINSKKCLQVKQIFSVVKVYFLLLSSNYSKEITQQFKDFGQESRKLCGGKCLFLLYK